MEQGAAEMIEDRLQEQTLLGFDDIVKSSCWDSQRCVQEVLETAGSSKAICGATVYCALDCR